jgi:hypothetical protein
MEAQRGIGGRHTILLAGDNTDWLGAATSITVAIIALIGTIVSAWITVSVRRQTTKSHQATPVVVHEPSSRGQEVDGFIVRFIIFSLVGGLFGAILNLANPFVYIGGRWVALAEGGFFTLIFLVFGLPLLVDISRRYGLRGLRRPTLRHR